LTLKKDGGGVLETEGRDLSWELRDEGGGRRGGGRRRKRESESDGRAEGSFVGEDEGVDELGGRVGKPGGGFEDGRSGRGGVGSRSRDEVGGLTSGNEAEREEGREERRSGLDLLTNGRGGSGVQSSSEVAMCLI